MVPSSVSDVSSSYSSSFYSELLKTMGKDGLEEEVNKRISSFNGLLTRDIAMKMISREKGIGNHGSDSSTGEVSRNSIITAVIRRILPEENYNSGKKSRAMEIQNSSAGGRADESAGGNSGGKTRILRLWNDDVLLFAKLRVGDEIIIRGAYEKNGILNLGYSGKVSLSKSASFAKIADIKSNHKTQIVNVRGNIVSVRPDSFEVSDCAVSIYVFGNTQTLAVGDEVILENVSADSGNLRLSGNSRLLVKKQKSVSTDTPAMTLSRKEALESMGVKVADDISLETIVNLKKSSLSNANQDNPVLRGDSHV